MTKWFVMVMRSFFSLPFCKKLRKIVNVNLRHSHLWSSPLLLFLSSILSPLLFLPFVSFSFHFSLPLAYISGGTPKLNSIKYNDIWTYNYRTHTWVMVCGVRWAPEMRHVSHVSTCIVCFCILLVHLIAHWFFSVFVFRHLNQEAHRSKGTKLHTS